MSARTGWTVPCGSRAVPRVRRIAQLALSCILLAPLSISAQEGDVLTLSEAVRLVTEDQPQLMALASQEQSALAAARAERELPDPKLAFGVQDVPATGADAWRIDREDMTMLTVGVMQDVTPRDRRQAASARMNAEAKRLSAERTLNARTIRRDVSLAWIDVLEAKQRATTLRSLLAELTAARDVSTARLSSGGAQATSVLAQSTALSSLRDELLLAERDEARARAALSRWIGDEAQRPFPDNLPHVPEVTPDPKAVSRTIDSHPALDAASHAIEAALRDVERARAERRPDWSWQLMYGQRQDDRSDMVSLQVTVGLPLNRADRQDQRLAGKLAEANAMRSDRADRQRQLEAELAAIGADLETSAARLREHQEFRLPAARAQLETAEASYAGGAGSLTDVWQARRNFIDAGLHHEMILADRARELARLAWLTGETEVLP